MCGEFNDGCALTGRHRRAHRRRPYQTPSYFSTQSHTNKITIYAQSAQTTSTIPCQSTQTPFDIHAQSIQTKCVGAVPMCLPERLRSGVSIQKYTHCARGDERCMRPCRATRAGTQAPPLPIPTKPCGVPLPHHIIHSIAHANRTVCSYPTVLHIRQLQTMRCAPTPSGLYFR